VAANRLIIIYMPVDYQPDLILNSLHGTSIFLWATQAEVRKGDGLSAMQIL
jgi:hypothetical protein